MAYSAPWRGGGYTAPWSGWLPSRGNLLTMQLIGDCQTNWDEIYPAPNNDSIYDAVGRDIRDKMIYAPPEMQIQMGDINDGDPFDVNLIKTRLNLYNQWCGDYGFSTYHVPGNHEIVYDGTRPIFTQADWAAHMGYEKWYYPIDFGDCRVLVCTGSGQGIEIDPDLYTTVPVRPMTTADVAWIDAQLASDSRPTILAVHGQLMGMATDAANDWRMRQSTVASGATADDLRAVLDAHPHAIGWMHGHTHSGFAADPPNTSLYNVGSRNIAVVDAGALYQKPNGNRTKPVTFYVAVLDDGKTLEVHWRNHEAHSWATVPGHGFKHRITAT